MRSENIEKILKCKFTQHTGTTKYSRQTQGERDRERGRETQRERERERERERGDGTDRKRVGEDLTDHVVTNAKPNITK